MVQNSSWLDNIICNNNNLFIDSWHTLIELQLLQEIKLYTFQIYRSYLCPSVNPVLFLVWDLLGAESDLNYWVHRPSCCWSLDQYYMKHIPSQGRIGLGSLGLVPQNDLKTRVLQGKTHQLVSEMWCVGCFVRRFLEQKLIQFERGFDWLYCISITVCTLISNHIIFLM